MEFILNGKYHPILENAYLVAYVYCVRNIIPKLSLKVHHMINTENMNATVHMHCIFGVELFSTHLE